MAPAPRCCRRRFGTSGSVLAAMLLACAAVPAADTGDAQVHVLEEIVVTATRRQLSISDVPLAMSVLSSEDLAQTRVRAFRDYLSSIPGVAFSDVGYADAKITVRGVSTDIFSEVRDLTAVYFDEIPVSNPGSHLITQSAIDPYLVDVRQVELLRGPQGTLFGANSMGGTLRVLANRPEHGRFASYAEATVATIEHGGESYGVNGMLNVPFGADSALRLVGYYEDSGGYIDNVGTGRRDANSAELLGGRAAVAIPLGERLSFDLTLMHQDRHVDANAQVNIALPQLQQFTHLNEYWDDVWTVYNALGRYLAHSFEIMSSTSLVDRDWKQLGDLSGSDFLAAFGVTTGTATADHRQDLKEVTQEFRLTSLSDGRFSWVGGAFFQDRDLTWSQSFPAPGFDDATDGLAAEYGNPDNLGSGSTDFEHQQFAVYGEVSIDLVEAWTLALGGRWFRFEESSHRAVQGILAGGTPEPYTNEADEDGFVPKATLSWSASPASLVYATASQGFRPGGPNFAELPMPFCEDELALIGLDEAPTSYQSDSLWNYELGVRIASQDGRLRGSAAAFYIDWSDVQILGFLGGDCGNAFMSNAAEARSRGVEAEFEWLATDTIQVGLSGAYVDAEVTRDVTVLSIESGEPLPGVPELTLQASVTWRFDVGEAVDGYLRADYRYVDETYGIFVPEGSPRLVAPSYEVVDLHLGIQRRAWNVSLDLTNLLDEYGIVNRVDDFGLHPGGDYQNVLQPRTIGLSVGIRFE